MLEFNADKRLTVAEIKEHPWYKGYKTFFLKF